MLTSVLVDQREPEWVQKLTFGGVPKSIGLLEYGDVCATCDDDTILAVERKTDSDLLGSLKSSRLFPQLVGLRQMTPWCYLVITGAFVRGADGMVITDHGATGWSWNSVSAALLTIQELGVFVVQIAETDFERFIVGLGRRSRREILRVTPAKQPSIISPGEMCLASLPGIGPERVESLLQYAGSPAAALAYLSDLSLHSDLHIPGIGLATKLNARKALGLAAWSELAVICTETKIDKEGENHDA